MTDVDVTGALSVNLGITGRGTQFISGFSRLGPTAVVGECAISGTCNIAGTLIGTTAGFGALGSNTFTTGLIENSDGGSLKIGGGSTSSVSLGAPTVPLTISSTATLADGATLVLGGNGGGGAGSDTTVSIDLTAGESISEGALLKLVISGVSPRLMLYTPEDATSVPPTLPIGLSATSGTVLSGARVAVAKLGKAAAIVEDGATIGVGDYVEASTTGIGRVVGTALRDALKTLGVAYTAATGTPAEVLTDVILA